MGIKVIDKASGKELELSSAEATEAWRAGAVTLVDGRVKIRRENETGTIDAAELPNAESAGWSLADEDEVAAATIRREESDLASSALGVGEGLAAGATLGLSTLAQEYLGGDPERMAARREGLGGWGEVLPIAGAVIPALATGGTGLAARALGATPAGMLARGGAAAARATAGAAESGLVRRVLIPSAFQNAVEGAGFAAGTELDESVLGQRDEVAARVLAAGGLGALFGAATGPIIPGVLAARHGGRAPMQQIEEILAADAGLVASAGGRRVVDSAAARPAATMAERFFRSPTARAFVKKTSPGLAHQVDEVYDFAANEGAMFREILSDPRAAEERLVRAAREPLEDFVAGTESSLEVMSRRNRMKNLKGGLPRDREVVLSGISSTAKVMQEVDAKVADALERHVAENASFVVPDLNNVRKIAFERASEFMTIPSAGLRAPRERLAAAFDATDQMRFELQALKDSLRRAGGANGPRDIQNTYTVVSEAVDILAKHQRDARVFGELATRYGEYADLASTAARARENIRGTKSGKVIDPFTNGPIDNADLLHVVKNSSSLAGETKTELLMETLAAERRQMEWALTHLDLSEADRAVMKRAASSSDRLTAVFGEQRKKARIMDLMGRWKDAQQNRILEHLPLGVIGATALGPAAALGGMAASVAFRPYSMVRAMATLGGHAGKTDKAIGEILDTLTGRISGKAPRAVGPAAGRRRGRLPAAAAVAAAITGEGGTPAKIQSIARLSTDMRTLLERADAMTANLEDVAPQAAMAMRQKMLTATMFLREKLPPSFTEPTSSAKPMYDDVALEVFERYLAAVEQPLDVMRKLNSSSRDITPEHVEALRAVWPELYGPVREQILDAVEDALASGKDIDLEDAMTLGLFFDAPIDPTLPVAQSIRLAFSSARQPGQEQPPPTPTQQRRVELDTKRLDTPATRIARGLQ